MEESGGKSEADRAKTKARKRNLLLMSVAYAANIGGTAVITGSPPNLVVLEVRTLFNIEFTAFKLLML